MYKILPLCCFFQDLDASIAREEEALQYIEGQAEAVKVNTSPAGAELITKEVEELRLEWQKLREALVEIHAELKGSMDTQREYYSRREKLAEGIKRLRALVNKMSRQLENKDRERSEENMVAQWKSYTVSTHSYFLTLFKALNSGPRDNMMCSKHSRNSTYSTYLCGSNNGVVKSPRVNSCLGSDI